MWHYPNDETQQPQKILFFIVGNDVQIGHKQRQDTHIELWRHVRGRTCNFSQNAVCLLARLRVQAWKTWVFWGLKAIWTSLVVLLMKTVRGYTNRHESPKFTIESILLNETTSVINNLGIVLGFKSRHNEVEQVTRALASKHHCEPIDYFELTSTSQQV